MMDQEPTPLPLTRRKFLQMVAIGSVLTIAPPLPQPLASTQEFVPPQTETLYGPEIDLVVSEITVNFSGRTRTATAINGSVPGPTLRFREGDTVIIRVKNELDESTSIHWHGIILPYTMDGVPGLSFQGIEPGETFTYTFTLQQSGTYWYHSHTEFQEMTGMYGALIIDPKEPEPIAYDQEFVIQVSDWTDDDPMYAFKRLRMQSDAYNFNQPTTSDFFSDIGSIGLSKAIKRRKMWNEMRMSPADLADLSSNVLTFLLNGHPNTQPWRGLFQPGQRIRLRFINSASNTLYDMRIPGLPFEIIQADGQNVVPVTVDEFRFGPGETYDAIITPTAEAYTIFAQEMGRTGYACGILATNQIATASIPPLDPREWLAMKDMMGDMSKMHHGGSGHHGGMALNHMEHNGMCGPKEQPSDLSKPSQTVRHASTEYGPSTDMRVNTPRTNLDDPGIGLRKRDWKVLTLNDLHSTVGVLDDQRTPTREIELHLTGNMERYTWSFDGLEFGHSTPVSMHKDERIRVILQNDTMMTHPIHLHGMWSDLEDAEGNLRVRRHTIQVQPAQRISFLTTPKDLGRWAWHCHLAFHMDAGMFREVVVS